MSIVGTRPPLISETNLYEPRHKVIYQKYIILQSSYLTMKPLRIFM